MRESLPLLTNPTGAPVRRSARDAYWTPPHLTQALLDRVPEVRGTVWEPCAGAGWMLDVLGAEGPRVAYGTDVLPQREDVREHDFLVDDWRDVHPAGDPPDWIVTNPPFVLGADILRHALSITPRVALLVRLTFLEGTRDRLDLFREHPPARVIMLPRTAFPRGDGRPQSGTDSVPPCWLVWGVEPRPVAWAS